MPFDIANWPPTTRARNSGSDLVGRRTYSTTHTTTARSTTPLVPPNLAESAQDVGGDGGFVLGAESRQAHVPRRQPEVGADHGEHDSDPHRGADHEGDRDRERDTRLGLRVEVMAKMARQTGVTLDLLDDRLTRHPRRLDLRPAPSDEAHDPGDRRTCADRQQQDHGTGLSPLCPRVNRCAVIQRSRPRRRPCADPSASARLPTPGSVSASPASVWS